MSKTKVCRTCGNEMHGEHCYTCEPAAWFDDLAEWHEDQARQVRQMAQEEREREKHGA